MKPLPRKTKNRGKVRTYQTTSHKWPYQKVELQLWMVALAFRGANRIWTYSLGCNLTFELRGAL
jgi:hypothetical protein